MAIVARWDDSGQQMGQIQNLFGGRTEFLVEVVTLQQIQDYYLKGSRQHMLVG